MKACHFLLVYISTTAINISIFWILTDVQLFTYNCNYEIPKLHRILNMEEEKMDIQMMDDDLCSEISKEVWQLLKFMVWCQYGNRLC